MRSRLGSNLAWNEALSTHWSLLDWSGSDSVFHSELLQSTVTGKCHAFNVQWFSIEHSEKKNHKLASLQLSGPDGVIRWGTHFNLINQMSSYSPCLFEVKRPWQNHVRRHFSLLTDGAARKVLQQPLNSFRDTFKKTLLWFHFMFPGCFKLIVNLEHNSDVLFKLINASQKC